MRNTSACATRYPRAVTASPPPAARRRRRAFAALVAGAVTGLALFPGVGYATIEEQRARLPPPATCADGVEGVWLSHTYNPVYRDWYMFTLRIRRKAAGSKELVGEIEVLGELLIRKNTEG